MFFPVLLGYLTGGLGAKALWVLVFSTASYIQLIWPPTADFLSSPGLYNDLTPTLLPASVTIALIQPVHDRSYNILIFLDRMHLLFTQVHFDSPAGSEVNIQHRLVPELPLPFITTLIGLQAFGLMSSPVWWEALTNKQRSPRTLSKPMYGSRPCSLVQAITRHKCPDPHLGSWNCLPHQAHIAPSESMSSIDQQGSSLGLFPTFPSRLSPL